MKTDRKIKMGVVAASCGFFSLSTMARGAVAMTETESIIELNGSAMVVEQDDPAKVANLDKCTTLDESIVKKCQGLLMNAMKCMDGIEGQVAVIDARTGRLKAWVALQKNHQEIADAKLLRKACSSRVMTMVEVIPMLANMGKTLEDSIDVCGGVYNTESGVTVRDHNWRQGGYGVMTIREALLKKSNVAMYKVMEADMGRASASDYWRRLTENLKETNAMELAALLGSVYNGNRIVHPTLVGDAVDVEISNKITPLGYQYMREMLMGLNKADGIQAKYAPKGIELAGIYGSYAENGLPETSFVGVFPATDPIYSIGVFVHSNKGGIHSSKDLAKSVVNELVEWLSKYESKK